MTVLKLQTPAGQDRLMVRSPLIILIPDFKMEKHSIYRRPNPA